MEAMEMKLVPFMGAELAAAKDGTGQIWAGIGWMCRGLGLTRGMKDRQVRNIQKDKVLARGYARFGAGVFDPSNETTALKLEFVPLWLAKISVTPTMLKNSPEVAERLTEYQLKAKDVLAAAFLPKGDILDLGQLSPLMQVLVRMEQHQRTQDRAMQELADRLTELEYPIPLAPLAPPKPGPDESRSRPATDHLWQMRCHGILYRAAKKAKKPQSQLELECCWRAANRSGERLEPGVRMMDEVAVNAVLRDAFIREVNELAEMYGV